MDTMQLLIGAVIAVQPRNKAKTTKCGKNPSISRSNPTSFISHSSIFTIGFFPSFFPHHPHYLVQLKFEVT